MNAREQGRYAIFNWLGNKKGRAVKGLQFLTVLLE